ncbi:Hypothetical predicted protein, partial [Paramuricea clavata]
PAVVYSSITEALGCENTEADQLFCSLQQLVKNCLYENVADRQSIAALFPGKIPGDFHKNLKDLLAKIISDHM